MTLIERARKGEIAILNDGTPEQLNKVLDYVWPGDRYDPKGNIHGEFSPYYQLDPNRKGCWQRVFKTDRSAISVHEFLKEIEATPSPSRRKYNAIRLVITDELFQWLSKNDRERIPRRAINEVSISATNRILDELEPADESPEVTVEELIEIIHKPVTESITENPDGGIDFKMVYADMANALLSKYNITHKP